MSTKPYYDKYFPDGLVDGSFSVAYLLCIWLNQDVTSDMLDGVGLVLDDEDLKSSAITYSMVIKLLFNSFCPLAQEISMAKAMNYPTAGKRTSPP